MSTVIKRVILILVSVNLFFSAWYVMHSDVYFFTDIARDFLLFQEIDEKKLIFIGPRASVEGLFHGPAWLYLNYPAFLLGNGNPVIVGWYWILLIVAFLGVGFFIAKKLFNETAAYIYIFLLSFYFIFHARELLNPYGAFFLIPVFFFTFVRYLQTKNYWYLAAHFALAGLIFHFQMAVGIPLIALSSLFIVVYTVKNKKILHLTAFFFLLLMLSNFILFDIRHEFLQAKSIQKYITSQHGNKLYNDPIFRAQDRLRLMLTGGHGLEKETTSVAYLLGLATAAFLFLQIRNNKHKTLYLSFLYFYGGYFLFTLINKGPILYHHHYPLISLATLIFASFVTSRYSRIFFFILLFLLVANYGYTRSFIQLSYDFIGKNEDSWKGLLSVTKTVYADAEGDFGYFLFSPDVWAYESRYAMSYGNHIFPNKGHLFLKMQTTYIVISPLSSERPDIQPQWWKEHQIHITKDPEKIFTFPNGYSVEKYKLTPEETKIPFDPSLNTGLHFR